MVELSHTTPITIKDIEAMEARGSSREIVNGQWVDASEEKMAGELPGAIATHLIIALGLYVKAHQLGRVYPADTTDIAGLTIAWSAGLATAPGLALPLSVPDSPSSGTRIAPLYPVSAVALEISTRHQWPADAMADR